MGSQLRKGRGKSIGNQAVPKRGLSSVSTQTHWWFQGVGRCRNPKKHGWTYHFGLCPRFSMASPTFNHLFLSREKTTTTSDSGSSLMGLRWQVDQQQPKQILMFHQGFTLKIYRFWCEGNKPWTHSKLGSYPVRFWKLDLGFVNMRCQH